VSVRVSCPHCQGPCLVAEQYLGVPVQCARCGQPFTARGEAEEVPRLEVGAATSPGRARTRNEDSFLVQHLAWNHLADRHDLALLIVADGMGGAEAGDRASWLVVGTVAASLGPLLAGAFGRGLKDFTSARLTQAVTAALHEANRTVYQAAQAEPACRGMGATAAVVLICDGRVVIGHVGDCRVYHSQEGQLTQVTRDQTLVARMVELGKLTPREALRHPSRHEVSQAVGRAPELEPASYQLMLSTGDWLVIACDGLHAHLDHAALESAVAHSAPAAGLLAQDLVERADQLGGSDNCTVLTVRCY
jgi:serine/threonine protein phosphatase PrpC